MAWYADWQASQALGVTQQPEYGNICSTVMPSRRTTCRYCIGAGAGVGTGDESAVQNVVERVDEAIARRGTKTEDFSEEDTAISMTA